MGLQPLAVWSDEDFLRHLVEAQPKTTRAKWPLALAKACERGILSKTLNSILKRSYPSRPFIEIPTPGGVLIGDLRDRYSRKIAGARDFEVGTFKLILEHCDCAKSFIDVGANLGGLSVAVAREGIRVLALEPDPDTARRLAAALALNQTRDCFVYNGAAGDAPGELSFFSKDGQTEAASVHAEVIGEGLRERRVPVETVDRLSRLINPVGFLKVDVEGHEPAVFRGSIETIRRNRPILLFEYHWEVAPKLGWSAAEVTDLVDSVAPYDWSTVVGSDRYAFPPKREMGLVANVLGVPRLV